MIKIAHFNTTEAADLLRNKTIVFMGGSVVRGLYKDLVWALNTDLQIDYKVKSYKKFYVTIYY